MADVEALFERFMDLSWSEPLTLEEYVERLARGDEGPVSKREIRELIDRVERVTLANVETKAEEGGIWREQAESAALAALARFAALRERFGDPPSR